MTQPLLTRRAAGLAAAAILAPLTGARANNLDKARRAGELLISISLPSTSPKVAARWA